MFRFLKFLLFAIIIAIAVWVATSDIFEKIAVFLKVLPFVN